MLPSLSPRNLVFWMTLFATVGAWLALPQRPSPLRVPPEPPPWIPLPASGMDASQASVRGVLRTGFPEIDAFAVRCGGRDDAIVDRYQLTDLRNPWQPTDSIEFLPSGESIDVAIREDALPVPPIDATHTVARRAARFVHARLSRQAAEPIRRLWDTQVLWHAEQSIAGCSHGGGLVLQACVRGQYAIRVRDCGADITPARSTLWEAVSSVLPVVSSREDPID